MKFLSKTYDNWSPERIGRHLLYWSGWLIFYALVNGNSYDNGNYGVWAVFELCVLPIKLFLTYFIIYYLVPLYAAKKQYTQLTVIAIAMIIAGGLLFRTLDYYFVSRHLISSDIFLEKVENEHFWSFTIAYKVLDLLFVVTLVGVIKFVQQQFKYERRTKALMTEKLETELKFLKHQLQPHFLFNTLNNLYGLVLTKDDKASEVVLKFSQIMNYMLYESNDRLIPLKKELNNLSNFVALEKLRHGDELEVQYSVHGNVNGKQIPPFILFSFVENAFKHGPGDNFEKSWIKIGIDAQKDKLLFKCENSVPKENDKKVINPRVNSGIGLSNVSKRLELIYGPRYHLKLNGGETYSVELQLAI
ncbi:sensor histidine kinase [Flagellimonas algicola]|uniref:Sensor histidine kinase n=1 Tax=Flagellimonas algicola TaxID=2583815 RepID=A0ABY2WGI3_9FLAO|nr:histidine kinase [Allomuricauda algicola]TMU50400.1 sensor histidine kinase [Allomuricauda algicola]